MAIRQYIGARYVPRFLGTYDPTQIYDALDVVDNGSGTSYIARKTVPAGTPLTDTDHWFVYGAASGAIIQLQNDMIQAQNDISNIDNVELPAIRTSIERNILIIGNSYVGYGVADKLAATFDNAYKFTRGGSGFTLYTLQADTFIDALNDAIASATFDNDSITDIIFCSAMGDTRAYTEYGASTYESMLRTSLGSIKTLINTNFTNCKRVKVTLAESRNVPYHTGIANPYTAIFRVHALFKKVFVDYDMEYIGWSGFNSLFVAADFQSDNYHPSATGASRIGEWIKGAYSGRMEYMDKYSVADCSFRFIVGSGDTCRVTCIVRPDTTTIQMKAASISSGVNSVPHESALATFSELECPPPAPYADIELYDQLITPSNGTERQWLEYTITSQGTTGIARLYNLRDTSSTVGFVAGLPTMRNFTYPNA